MKRGLIASSIVPVLVLSELLGFTRPDRITFAHDGVTLIDTARPVAEVPFELAGTGHAFVRVLVNRTPGFILDTANHGMSVDTEFARRAGLNLQKRDCRPVT